MKRIFLILFSVLYLFTVSGFALNLHYCGGKLRTISVAFDVDEENCCGSKKMKKKDCCKNDFQFIKIKDDQQNIHSVKVPPNDFKQLALFVLYVNEQTFSTPESKSYTDYYSPPLIPKDPLYLQNRVLMI